MAFPGLALFGHEKSCLPIGAGPDSRAGAHRRILGHHHDGLMVPGVNPAGGANALRLGRRAGVVPVALEEPALARGDHNPNRPPSSDQLPAGPLDVVLAGASRQKPRLLRCRISPWMRSFRVYVVRQPVG